MEQPVKAASKAGCGGLRASGSASLPKAKETEAELRKGSLKVPIKDIHGVLDPELVAKLEAAKMALAAERYEEANQVVQAVLAVNPVHGEANYIAGRIAIARKEWDQALWFAFAAMSCEHCSESIERDIIEVVHEKANRETTRDMVHGIIAGFKGDMDEALRLFQLALAHSSKREDKIRAIQFLCLTAQGLEKTDAAIGFAKKLQEYDPQSYIAHVWLSDLYALKGDHEASEKEADAARDLLISAEKAAASVSVPKQVDDLPHLDLRRLIEESDTPLLAPFRAFLVSNPGKSNLWEIIRDELFGFDQIFGVSEPLMRAKSLSMQVQKAVENEQVKTRIKLEHPMPNPFSTEATVAETFEVQKVMASNARPALLQLYAADGTALKPRLLWKSGDDLRRDLIAESFFEIFNLIWSHTLENFEPQITYGILPLRGKFGFLEWVEGTQTQEKFNWQKADPESWMPTFAASMTAAYAIGAEDRHARNILIQDRRKVFQIDFGYLFGQVPGMGLGAGPALPFGKHVSHALTSEQRGRFIDYSVLLFQVLGMYKDELAGMAARFTEVVKLAVPLTINIKTFMQRQLGSTVLFSQAISRAERDVGRMRKEYMALAWGNKTFFPKDYGSFVEKSNTLADSGILELIDPELLKNRVQRKSNVERGFGKFKRAVASPFVRLASAGKKDKEKKEKDLKNSQDLKKTPPENK